MSGSAGSCSIICLETAELYSSGSIPTNRFPQSRQVPLRSSRTESGKLDHHRYQEHKHHQNIEKNEKFQWDTPDPWFKRVSKTCHLFQALNSTEEAHSANTSPRPAETRYLTTSKVIITKPPMKRAGMT